jgi:small subunit ribosomal protein S16
MARGGRKGRPFYRIVVADKRMPRDGRYIEKLGTYNPLLANDDDKRVVFNEERVKFWLGQGAKPSTRVARFLGQAGVIETPSYNETPKKSAPSERTLEKRKEKEEKLKAAQEAKEEAPAEEAKEEAPAEEAKEEAPAEEAKEEAPAEEAKEEAPAEEEKKEG